MAKSKKSKSNESVRKTQVPKVGKRKVSGASSETIYRELLALSKRSTVSGKTIKRNKPQASSKQKKGKKPVTGMSDSRRAYLEREFAKELKKLAPKGKQARQPAKPKIEANILPVKGQTFETSIFGQSVIKSFHAALEGGKKVGVKYKGKIVEITKEQAVDFEELFESLEWYYLKKCKELDISPQMFVGYIEAANGNVVFNFDSIDMADEELTEELENENDEFKKTKSNFNRKINREMQYYGITKKSTAKSKQAFKKGNSKKSKSK